MRVAVVGAGITGLAAAYVLAKEGVEVVLYEKEDYLGGRARTVSVAGVDVDLGFMVLNGVRDPTVMKFFVDLDIDIEMSEMSFSMSLDDGEGYEWGNKNGVLSLFAQKRNTLNPYFLQMIREIHKFKNDVLKYLQDLEDNPDLDRNETLGHFIKSHGYSDLFKNAYLIPICSSIWSCESEGVLGFSAFLVLSFCRNFHLIELFSQPKWLTVNGWSSYVNKIRRELDSGCCDVRTKCAVQSVLSANGVCHVLATDGSNETYDGCIVAMHEPDVLKILGEQATYDESRVLGAFQYVCSNIFLHHDENLMPRNKSVWSAWNFLGSSAKGASMTYWLNAFQSLGISEPVLVTLNPSSMPKYTCLGWVSSHPIPSLAASKALVDLKGIQGRRGIWFCGDQGFGFDCDGLKVGISSALGILGKNCVIQRNIKQTVYSIMETGAQMIVARFLQHYISTGFLMLLEDVGTIFSFGKNHEKSFKSLLKVHDPVFYWKIATKADLGLADAYINGDFSFVDEQEGLLNLFMIFIANRDKRKPPLEHLNKRGWWTPLLLTAALTSARYFLRHVSRKNSITQARENISRHYDLSNNFFSLFLDETMTYSCAIFKTDQEDLKVAQLRKISLLIEKAKIDSTHEILEIGCGWGSLAIEVVKKYGCKYTGITLSKEQLDFAENKVKAAGFEDHITLILCDYRQLPSSKKFDRIISCEMIEAVGHEYMEEFFGCCESLLADDGVFVLQFISIPDERYEEHRKSSEFMKEYIFPGGCLPSLSRIISAMASSSRFCVEHIENIGLHYYQTLRYWRKNFLEKKSEILALGFDEKFLRTWEYYFLYCAAGFKSLTIGDYQVVFSRPGNLKAFGAAHLHLPAINC